MLPNKLPVVVLNYATSNLPPMCHWMIASRRDDEETPYDSIERGTFGTGLWGWKHVILLRNFQMFPAIEELHQRLDRGHEGFDLLSHDFAFKFDPCWGFQRRQSAAQGSFFVRHTECLSASGGACSIP